MVRVVKGFFAMLSVVGLAVIALMFWSLRQLDAYQAMSPAQQAEVDRRSAERAEADRKERLIGTDCEKLDALSCYDMRRKRKNLETAAREWENSDMKKAYEDAGR